MPYFKPQSCLLDNRILQDFKNYQSLSDYIDRNGAVLETLDDSGWVIGSKEVLDLKRKIEAGSVPIKKLDITINFGIKTGFNEAFIIDEGTRKELIAKCPECSGIIKPLLRGKDTSKYKYTFANLYLLFIPWHFPLHEDRTVEGASEKAEKTFKEMYPPIYDHLLGFKDALKERNQAETGIRYEWYALQRCAATYFKDFEKEKIFWGELSDKPKFAFEPGKFYMEATLFLMTGENLKYILAILNSKLSEWYFNLISSSSGMGTNRWKKYKIELFPIKDPREVNTEVVIQIVHQLLAITQDADYFSNTDKQAQVKEYEKQIDQMVYDLYGLTEEEIRLVEGKANIGSEAEPILAIASATTNN